jgi:transposase-like protein
MKSQVYTLKQFDNQFPDDNACLEFLVQARWPNGILCPKCQKVTKHYRIKARKSYGCEFCGTQVSPTADTIFDHSPTPLRSWFHAFFLIASTRCGISAKQLQREVGVTYKTAWRMFHQIRTVMAETQKPMFGSVEIDESYFGGKKSGKRGRSLESKTPVVGIVQRGGPVATKVVPNVKARTLLPVLWKQVPRDINTTVYTDELGSYNLVQKLGYTHKTIQHAAKRYARGLVHTNTIEGFWSLVKRGIDGVYHAVSPKYLQTYLDEYGFRYNHRDDSQPMFFLLLNRVPALAPCEAARLGSREFQIRLL